MITKDDVQNWKNLGWFGRFKRRRKYTGMPYREVYRTLEWEEYTYWVFSNCDYIILSGGGSLLPDIMKTPVADREAESKRRSQWSKNIERLMNTKFNKPA